MEQKATEMNNYPNVLSITEVSAVQIIKENNNNLPKVSIKFEVQYLDMPS